MNTPIGLEELRSMPPVAGEIAARTVGQLTDAVKRRLIWFLQWRSHQSGGLKKLAHEILTENSAALGTPTMHRVGFTAGTEFSGNDFEAICAELNFYPLDSLANLARQRQFGCANASLTLADFLDDNEASVRERPRRLEAQQRFERELETKMKPENRRLSAHRFLLHCRELAKSLPETLSRISADPLASWDVIYFRDLRGALVRALEIQAVSSARLVANTKVADMVQDALAFAHRTKSLVIVKGTERLGKTEAARSWAHANPDKARLISLSAGTTDSLFYGEIFDALGCSEARRDNNGELRGSIRSALQTGDLALVIDEAHCLFGLSSTVSIKRLEYIRTEFVNRGIPVVLVITPQFAARLSELERRTSFNVNQFRGRVARWVELPQKPKREDVECLCRFCLPDVSAEVYALLTSFALESEYPFAAAKHAITEARELQMRQPGTAISVDLMKRAIGFALFTNSQVAATLPAPTSSAPRRGRSRAGAVAPISTLCPSGSEAGEEARGQTTPVAPAVVRGGVGNGLSVTHA